jgi:hypothetical protein
MSLRVLSFASVFAIATAATSLGHAQVGGTQDNLNLRYANGIAAIVEDRIITVDDIRREIGAYIPEIQRQARNEEDFNQKLESLQEEVIQNLIDKVPPATLITRLPRRLSLSSTATAANTSPTSASAEFRNAITVRNVKRT